MSSYFEPHFIEKLCRENDFQKFWSCDHFTKWKLVYWLPFWKSKVVLHFFFCLFVCLFVFCWFTLFIVLDVCRYGVSLVPYFLGESSFWGPVRPLPCVLTGVKILYAFVVAFKARTRTSLTLSKWRHFFKVRTEFVSSLCKGVAKEILHPLTAIFNRSLSTGKVPDSLKIAKVIPIHKKDDKEIFSNYRPVSVLPCFPKILERLM